MALADPLFIRRAPLTHGPSFQTQPFDIDLLCAKLEVAKLEQDAERARQRLRQLTTDNRDNASQISRQYDSPMQPRTWASSTQSAEKARPRCSPDARNSVHPKEAYTTMSMQRAGSGQSHVPFNNDPVQDPRKDEYNVHRSQRNSNDNQELDNSPRQQSIPRRKPVARSSDVGVNTHNSSSSHNTTQRQSINERPLSREMANRRSKTFPLQGCRLPLKHHSITSGYDHTETNEEQQQQQPPHTSRKSTPKPKRAATTNSYEEPESPMGLVNEYTISFDLADYHTDYYKPSKKQRTSDVQEESPPNEATRSKSLLSLPLLSKKDKTQVKTTEVMVVSPQEQSPISPMRPSTGVSQFWHSRQQSLPLDFANEGAMKRPTWMMEGQQRQSKRRSLVGWLKKL